MSRPANRRNTLVSFFLTMLAVVVVASPAAAQAPGIRGGVSVDPDQIYFGGHYETGPLVDRLHFKPNLEAGFGDDLVLVAFNFEFVYKFPRRGEWGLYAGGGPAVNFISFDDLDDSETEAGFNVLIGVESARGLMFELKIGALDSPNLKFGVGWTFR